ncbi:MAG: hypothetical protein QXT63_08665, partial [Thermoplasmata archaeon]
MVAYECEMSETNDKNLEGKRALIVLLSENDIEKLRNGGYISLGDVSAEIIIIRKISDEQAI